MSGVLTDEDIRVLVGALPWPIERLEETNTDWLLGGIKIHKSRPVFSHGYGGTLGPTSRFRKQAFDDPEKNLRGWAVIFRAFDRGATTGAPEDLFAGWVPSDREADVDKWIEFLNTEIRDRLSPPSQVVQGSGANELTIVGAFREFGYSQGPALATLRGKRGSANKDAVVRYLESGKLKVMSPGIEKDVFDATRSADALHVLTDGRYAWHRLLAYYVRNYDVELPSEFEEHMAANGYSVPSNIQTKQLKLPGAKEGAR